MEASATAHKIFRAEGIRIIANSKTSYTMSVSYKPVSGPYQRVNLATSTHAPKITHSGKSYKIDGVQSSSPRPAMTRSRPSWAPVRAST